MKPPVAGVAVPEEREVTIMTVWPTIAVTGVGRWLGRLYAIRAGFSPVFSLGNLIAVLSIPLALLLFFAGLAPGAARRYTLTNRRLVIRKGLAGVDERWVSLDNFDGIEVEVLPGQEWFHAGELIFKKGQIETFRISAVPRPQTFKHTCLKAQRAYTAVSQVRQLQAAHA